MQHIMIKGEACSVNDAVHVLSIGDEIPDVVSEAYYVDACTHLKLPALLTVTLDLFREQCLIALPCLQAFMQRCTLAKQYL